MADRPVTHVRRRRDGVVHALALPGAAWSPRMARDVVRDIEGGRHHYYVPWGDGRVDIHVVAGPYGPYLRTDWDDTAANNLDDLPEATAADRRDRHSVTTWTRLEPGTRSTDPGQGLAARVYDPLWLLCRQWQLGEYEPSDGGSPVLARLRASYTVLDRYGPGLDAHELAPFDAASAPLETLVEREPPSREPDLREAATGGLHFLRLLAASGAGHLRGRYVAHYGLAPPEEDGGTALDGRDARFAVVMAGRVPDGRRLYAELDAAVRPGGDAEPGLPDGPGVPEADRAAVLQAAHAWLAWHDAAVRDPSPAADSWVPERMEHAFTVEAPAPDGGARLALAAQEYPGGHLDWYSFDAHVREGEGGQAPVELEQTTLPGAVAFPGMPAPRWWELEDAQVDLGSVEAAAEDLVQMLLLEFALVHGNDWFVVPVELPVGALCRVRTLTVTDTFGVETDVAPVRAHDPQWRLFSLHGLAPEEDVLFLPPSLGQVLEGPALEEVLFLRDEMANMGWAVERVVQGATGRPVDRAEAHARARRRGENGREGAGPSAEADLAYGLAGTVPEHWVPLVPVQVGGGRQVRFRRGAMLDRDGVGRIRPRGLLLRPGRRLTLFEEEVPLAGVRLTRRDAYTRWADGSTHLWRARRKRPGRGEGWSGLEFDVLRDGG